MKLLKTFFSCPSILSECKCSYRGREREKVLLMTMTVAGNYLTTHQRHFCDFPCPFPRLVENMSWGMRLFNNFGPCLLCKQWYTIVGR